MINFKLDEANIASLEGFREYMKYKMAQDPSLSGVYYTWASQIIEGSKRYNPDADKMEFDLTDEAISAFSGLIDGFIRDLEALKVTSIQ